MNRVASIALLLLLSAPAFANPTFSEVIVETDDKKGSQPAGLPLWQTVSVDWEGNVEIRHFSPFHSDRFRGTATRAELDALEAAVKGARLGSIPDKFSAAPWGDKFEVKSSSSRLSGKTAGSKYKLGRYRSRLEPMLDAILPIAERIVNPPRLPGNQRRGRIEVRGWTTYFNLGGNRRYEVEPRAMAEELAALEGEWITVEGTLSGSSSWNREIEIKKLIDIEEGSVSGKLVSKTRLESGGREIELRASEDVADLLEALEGQDLELVGFVKQGPRGVKWMAVSGVRARMTDRSYPFEAGEVVTLTEVSTSGRYFDAVNDEGRTSSFLRRHLFDLTPRAGITSRIGQ
ncbi:MAG TPA: hypothetical protein DEA08_16670 [Planctomycetes bacterium]|nr:hypothetical protein [Planctomycetota bacterium]